MKTLLTCCLLFFNCCAHTMECEPQTPGRIVQSAQIAFTAELEAIEESAYSPGGICKPAAKPGDQCGGKLLTLRVKQSLRGSVPPRVSVISEDACYCLGAYWTRGETYLIIATPNHTQLPGQLIAANVCAGTGVLNRERRKLVQKFSIAKRQ